MSLFDKLLGKKPVDQSGSGTSSSKSVVANYSLVRDDTGTVVGLWLRDPQDADASRKGYIEALLMKHGAPHLIVAPRRIVPNKVNNDGGSFVMFGSQRAPGE